MYKLVPEHINEVHNFERGKQNKLTSLGVGQIHLIKSWLDEMDIRHYKINDDLTIDILEKAFLDLSNRNLTNFPDYIQFNNCDGGFYINLNNFTSLRGCPKKVTGSFDCSFNNLNSLEYCPEYIGVTFNCSHNKLINLKECPKVVNHNFYCHNNKTQFTEDEVRKYCKVKEKYIFI